MVEGNGTEQRAANDATEASDSESARPFRVLGVQQVAIGGLDLGALRNLWVNTLGVAKVGEYEAASENVREDILQLGSGPHAVEIDLMEPLDPEARPRVNDPALNHIGLWVDDLAAAVAWLTEQGMRFTPLPNGSSRCASSRASGRTKTRGAWWPRRSSYQQKRQQR